MTDKQLAAIEARNAARTPGEWLPEDVAEIVCYGPGVADRAFVFGATSDIPALLVEVKRLQRINAALIGIMSHRLRYTGNLPHLSDTLISNALDAIAAGDIEKLELLARRAGASQ